MRSGAACDVCAVSLRVVAVLALLCCLPGAYSRRARVSGALASLRDQLFPQGSRHGRKRTPTEIVRSTCSLGLAVSFAPRNTPRNTHVYLLLAPHRTCWKQRSRPCKLPPRVPTTRYTHPMTSTARARLLGRSDVRSANSASFAGSHHPRVLTSCSSRTWITVFA